MVNMFSGNREKKIPKSFQDCYKTDNVTNNLWSWAERLETIGIVIAVIVGIAGLIIGIVMSEDSDGVSLLISFFGAPIAAFFEYISFHIIALLIGSLASIVQSTKISADIALFTNKDNNINASTKNKKTKSTNTPNEIKTSNNKQSSEKNNKDNNTDDLIIYTGENTFDPCPSTVHKKYIEEIKNSSDIWTEHSHWEKYDESDEKILICNRCNNIIAFYNQLNYHICANCGEKIPVGVSRCKCGCTNFN